MPDKPGLQMQRTQLAWERSAVSFVAVAAILLFHQSGTLTWNRTLLSAVAMLMALLTMCVGRARGRITVSQNPAGLPVIRDPQRAVQLIGWGTTALAVSVAVMVLFD